MFEVFKFLMMASWIINCSFGFCPPPQLDSAPGPGMRPEQSKDPRDRLSALFPVLFFSSEMFSFIIQMKKKVQKNNFAYYS
jgi:hypothetical protein